MSITTLTQEVKSLSLYLVSLQSMADLPVSKDNKPVSINDFYIIALYYQENVQASTILSNPFANKCKNSDEFPKESSSEKMDYCVLEVTLTLSLPPLNQEAIFAFTGDNTSVIAQYLSTKDTM